MALFLVFNESENTKIALWTYLTLTLNEIMWIGHKLRYKRNIQLLAVTTAVVKVGAGAITKLIKGIPQQVSLRLKYLKNNGDSSFQM